MFLCLTIVLLLQYIHVTVSHDCIEYYKDQDSFACACSLNQCTTIESVGPVPKGYIHQWTSSRSKYRFHRSEIAIDDHVLTSLKPSTLEIQLDYNDRRQTIVGFGGAVTDSAGFNLLTIPIDLRDQIMIDYFSQNGLGYSLVRVPIGGSDFSLRGYTYDDHQDGDFDLKHFTLQPEDIQLKIPTIKRAMELRGNDLKLMGSCWSPPGWMKNNSNIINGHLKGYPGGKYYKTYAKYHVKFLEAYAKEGIDFWSLTTTNEPTNGLDSMWFYNSLAMTPELLRDYIKLDLGPALRDAGYGPDKLDLLMYDDKREVLPNYTETVLLDQETASYVSGIAIHWYADAIKYYENLIRAHDLFPDKYIISNEACAGYHRFSPRKAQIGNWTRAENYASDIIKDLHGYVTGWMDWNIVLNTSGGPTYVNNACDGLILIDANEVTYYRNPMFYAFGHFTKFIPPGSVYIGHKTRGDDTGISTVTFIDPSNQVVIVILNTNDDQINLDIKNLAQRPISISMEGHSIITLVTPRSMYT